MTTAAQGASGGGWFSKLVVVALLALAVGLYLQIVMLQPQPGGEKTATSSGDTQVRAETPSAPPATAASSAQAVRDLPEDQMALIKRVFAPEMGD